MRKLISYPALQPQRITKLPLWMVFGRQRHAADEEN